MIVPGALQLVATLLLIAWEVGGRSLGLWATPAWVMPLAWSHAYLTLFGLFPWSVFGFAMTAVPGWMNSRLPRGAWLSCALPMVAGLVLSYAGLAAWRELVVAGGLVHIAGWLAGLAALARIVFGGNSRDTQAIFIVFLLFVGAVAGILFLVGIAREEAGRVAWAGSAGLWLFLLPLFLVVSHRMIPFFSSRVLPGYAMYRPSYSLTFLGAACVTHYMLAVGYVAAMTLGVVSRVSLGHAGRALEADRMTWYGFLALIIAVVGSWAVRFVPMYLLPRVYAGNATPRRIAIERPSASRSAVER